MILKEQLLDYSKAWSKPDVYMFTGNNTLKSGDVLVMGRGAAKQVRDAFPGVDAQIGEYIKQCMIKFRQGDYGIIFANISPDQIVGAFQVKRYYSDDADLDIIRKSMKMLSFLALLSDYTFHLNFPGIGAGRLQYDDVLPIIENLPDNVIVYR
jgi:hypothetical protein